MIHKLFDQKQARGNVIDMNCSLKPTEPWEDNCGDSGHLLSIAIFDLFSFDNRVQ